MQVQVKQSPTPDFKRVVLPDVIRPIAERHAARALESIRAQWPVDTGKSRAGWRVDVLVLPGGLVRLSLINPVQYTSHVQGRGGKASAVSHAVGVMRDMLPAMNAEIGAAIARAYATAPLTGGSRG